MVEVPASLEALCALVRSNPPLAALRIRTTGVSAVLHNESVNVETAVLRFALPSPHPRAADWLASSLRTNTCLRELDLHGMNISDLSIAALARALTEGQVAALDLSCNRAGPAAAAALAALVATPSTLKVLNLNHNYVGNAGAETLSEGVAKSALTSLFLAQNGVGEEGIVYLTFAIGQTSLTDIHLSGNVFRGVVGRFANAVKASAINSLHAGDCALGDEGGVSMATILETSPRLTSLHLWGNELEDASAVAMANALASNRAMTWLSLRRNAIGDDGARALGDALKINVALLTLDLAGNRIAESGVRSLCEALREQERLTELDIAGNSFSGTADGEASSSLVSLLRDNTTLTSLNLAENAIKPSACLQIAAALEANTSIGAVYLSAASLGAEGMEMLTSDSASHFWESRVHVVAS